MARLLVVSRSMALALRLADSHEVVEHPAEALDTLDPDPQIDVIVLDVGEPATAVSVLDSLRRRGSLVPVLIVSGYQPAWAGLAALDLPGVVVVPLPITRTALLSGIERLESGRRARSAVPQPPPRPVPVSPTADLAPPTDAPVTGIPAPGHPGIAPPPPSPYDLAPAAVPVLVKSSEPAVVDVPGVVRAGEPALVVDLSAAATEQPVDAPEAADGGPDAVVDVTDAAQDSADDGATVPEAGAGTGPVVAGATDAAAETTDSADAEATDTQESETQDSDTQDSDDGPTGPGTTGTPDGTDVVPGPGTPSDAASEDGSPQDASDVTADDEAPADGTDEPDDAPTSEDATPAADDGDAAGDGPGDDRPTVAGQFNWWRFDDSQRAPADLFVPARPISPHEALTVALDLGALADAYRARESGAGAPAVAGVEGAPRPGTTEVDDVAQAASLPGPDDGQQPPVADAADRTADDTPGDTSDDTRAGTDAGPQAAGSDAAAGSRATDDAVPLDADADDDLPALAPPVGIAPRPAVVELPPTFLAPGEVEWAPRNGVTPAENPFVDVHVPEPTERMVDLSASAAAAQRSAATGSDEVPQVDAAPSPTDDDRTDDDRTDDAGSDDGVDQAPDESDLPTVIGSAADAPVQVDAADEEAGTPDAPASAEAVAPDRDEPSDETADDEPAAAEDPDEPADPPVAGSVDGDVTVVIGDAELQALAGRRGSDQAVPAAPNADLPPAAVQDDRPSFTPSFAPPVAAPQPFRPPVHDAPVGPLAPAAQSGADRPSAPDDDPFPSFDAVLRAATAPDTGGGRRGFGARHVAREDGSTGEQPAQTDTPPRPAPLPLPPADRMAPQLGTPTEVEAPAMPTAYADPPAMWSEPPLPTTFTGRSGLHAQDDDDTYMDMTPARGLSAPFYHRLDELEPQDYPDEPPAHRAAEQPDYPPPFPPPFPDRAPSAGPVPFVPPVPPAPAPQPAFPAAQPAFPAPAAAAATPGVDRVFDETFEDDEPETTPTDGHPVLDQPPAVTSGWTRDETADTEDEDWSGEDPQSLLARRRAILGRATAPVQQPSALQRRLGDRPVTTGLGIGGSSAELVALTSPAGPPAPGDDRTDDRTDDRADDRADDDRRGAPADDAAPPWGTPPPLPPVDDRADDERAGDERAGDERPHDVHPDAAAPSGDQGGAPADTAQAETQQAETQQAETQHAELAQAETQQADDAQADDETHDDDRAQHAPGPSGAVPPPLPPSGPPSPWSAHGGFTPPVAPPPWAPPAPDLRSAPPPVPSAPVPVPPPAFAPAATLTPPPLPVLDGPDARPLRLDAPDEEPLRPLEPPPGLPGTGVVALAPDLASDDDRLTVHRPTDLGTSADPLPGPHDVTVPLDDLAGSSGATDDSAGERAPDTWDAFSDNGFRGAPRPGDVEDGEGPADGTRPDDATDATSDDPDDGAQARSGPAADAAASADARAAWESALVRVPTPPSPPAAEVDPAPFTAPAFVPPPFVPPPYVPQPADRDRNDGQGGGPRGYDPLTDPLPDTPAALSDADAVLDRRSAPSVRELVRSLGERSAELFGVSETCQVLAEDVVDRAVADAAAVVVPDGSVWRVSGGVGLRPLERRLLLDARHWLVAEVAMGGHAVVVGPEAPYRAQLAGAPLAAWEHLLAIPVPEVNAAVVVARSRTGPPFTEADLAAVVSSVQEAAGLLSAAMATRRLARLLAPLAEDDEA